MDDVRLLDEPKHQTLLAADRPGPGERRADLDRAGHAEARLQPGELDADGHGAGSGHVVWHPQAPGVLFALHGVPRHHRGTSVGAIRILDVSAELGAAGVRPPMQNQSVVAVQLHRSSLTGDTRPSVVVGGGDGLCRDHRRVAEDELEAGHAVELFAANERLPPLPGCHAVAVHLHSFRRDPAPVRPSPAETGELSDGARARSAGGEAECLAAGSLLAGSSGPALGEGQDIPTSAPA